MSEDNLTPPKAFVSYSWSSPEHEHRVLDLARDLRESGVDVILDKWDLREGQEASAFMEKMVTDDSITKVIIVSDRSYQEKSDNRSGGAGTEAQIISPKLYAGEDEGKFVALVFERDEQGRAFLPAYYTSRIFIDFTDVGRATDSFEQLVRWVFNKPLHKKPKIGRAPAYLDAEKGGVTIGTGAAYRRALDAVQNSRPHAFAATQEYLTSFTDKLPAFRINVDTDRDSDEIIENYRSFLPYRNEVIGLVRVIARAEPDPRYGDALHEFLERFLQHFHPSPEMGQYREPDSDNYKFFAHELLLYLCTIAVVDKRPDLLEALLERRYYDRERSERGGLALESYEIFEHIDRLLEHRNKALSLNRPSLQADMLQERASGSGFRFEQLQQTDLILYLRLALVASSSFCRWYPITLFLLRRSPSPFEVFVRAQSKKELARLLPMLGLESREPLDTLIEGYADNSVTAPSYDQGWRRLDVAQLIGYAELGSRP